MVFKTSVEAMGFVKEFIETNFPTSALESNSCSQDDIHIIEGIFGVPIPEEGRHLPHTLNDDIIMIRRETASVAGDNCWLIVLFEGGDIVYGREESGGLIYVPLRSIRNQTIYRFETRFQKPYNLWGGLKDGFGIDLLWFGLGNKNTKSKTLNYSRRGFTNV
jgi:hypothetical protein